jgi:drug/metabolite transporter (DMT)-like permease
MAETTPEPRRSRARRHTGAETTGWIAGVVLIVLGVAFLLQQNGYVVLTGNWWAIFIYLLAAASFINVWRSYRSSGEFSSGATSSLIWGLVFTVVASIFMFNLSWDAWWPAILVAIGAGIVAGYLLRDATAKPEDRDTDQ